MIEVRIEQAVFAVFMGLELLTPPVLIGWQSRFASRAV